MLILLDAVIAVAFVVSSTRFHLSVVKLAGTQGQARASLVFSAVWIVAIVAAFFSPFQQTAAKVELVMMAVEALKAVFGKSSDADVIASIEAEPAYRNATFVERLTGAYLPKRYADAVARSEARRT